MVRNLSSESASISKAWHRLKSQMKCVTTPTNSRIHKKLSYIYSQLENALPKICASLSPIICVEPIIFYCLTEMSDVNSSLFHVTYPSHAVFLILNYNTSISYQASSVFTVRVCILSVSISLSSSSQIPNPFLVAHSYLILLNLPCFLLSILNISKLTYFHDAIVQ